MDEEIHVIIMEQVLGIDFVKMKMFFFSLNRLIKILTKTHNFKLIQLSYKRLKTYQGKIYKIAKRI